MLPLTSQSPLQPTLPELLSALDHVCKQPISEISSALEAIRGLTQTNAAPPSLEGLAFSPLSDNLAIRVLVAAAIGQKAPASSVAGASASLVESISVYSVAEAKAVEALTSGYNSTAEFLLAKLEQALYNRAEGKLNRKAESLILLIPPKAQPVILPDLVGTAESPGPFCLAVEKRLAFITIHTPKNWLTTPYESEHWPVKLAQWKADWAKFKTHLLTSPKQTYFSEHTLERKTQYLTFAFQLDAIFKVFCESDSDGLLFDQLEDIRSHCFNGWEERIDLLSRLALPSQQLDYQLVAHEIARDLRREVMLTQALPSALAITHVGQGWLATDAHLQHAAKQWGNESQQLGYDSAILFQRERAVMTFESAPRATEAMKLSFANHYVKQALLDTINAYYKNYKGERSSLLKPLLEAYQTDLVSGKAPFIDRLPSLAALYTKLAKAVEEEDPTTRRVELKKLHREFKAANIMPSYSVLTLRESLLEKLLSSDDDLSSWIFRPLKLELLDPSVTISALMPRLASAFEVAKADTLPDGQPFFTPKKVSTIESWLGAFALCEEAENRAFFFTQNEEQARVMSRASAEGLASLNCRLLEQHVVTGQELTPFGQELWLASAKLTEPLELDRALSQAEQLLVWASTLPIAATQADSIIPLLDSRPELYSYLSPADRTRAEVLLKREANPGLIYGVSKEQYDWVMTHPSQALYNPKHAWAKANKTFALLAVKERGTSLQYLDPLLQEDPEVVLAAVEHSGLALQWASPLLRKNRVIAMAAVQQEALAFQWVNEELRESDEEILLNAVRKNASALRWASAFLKGKKKIALAAVAQSGSALQWLPDLVKEDPDVVLIAVRQEGSSLQFASDLLKHDSVLALAAVTQDGMALRFVGDLLKASKMIVLAAVNQKGTALQWASDTLTADIDVVRAAVSHNGLALRWASDLPRSESSVVLTAVRQDGRALQFASDTLKDLKAVVLAAVGQQSLALQWASDELKKDREIVLEAVQRAGEALEWASPELKNDRDIVIAALTRNQEAIRWASPTLQSDPVLLARFPPARVWYPQSGAAYL